LSAHLRDAVVQASVGVLIYTPVAAFSFARVIDLQRNYFESPVSQIQMIAGNSNFPSLRH
jgi:hypothetical protein